MTRRLAAWLVIVLVFVALVVAAAAGAGDAGGPTRTIKRPLRTFDGTVLQHGGAHGAHVAVVPVVGEIVDGRSSASSGTVGGDDLIDELEGIRTSRDYDAVILEMDTPGGAVLASDEVSAEVRKVRAAGIPVVSWMRDLAASGGYYISASTSEIVAHPTTFTGSIGVILEYLDYAGLGRKYGVEQVVIKSGKLKDIGSPYKDITPEERAVLQHVIDQAYGRFVGVVARGRHLPEADVRKLADGRIYTGQDAKGLGLVDDLGARATAYRVAVRLVHDHHSAIHGRPEVTRFEPRTSLLEALGAAGSNRLDLGAVGQLLLGQARGGSVGNDLHVGATSALPATGDATTTGAGHGLPQVEYRAVLG